MCENKIEPYMQAKLQWLHKNNTTFAKARGKR